MRKIVWIKKRNGGKPEYTCCICGKKCRGYGNNPEPVVKVTEQNWETMRCCDKCNREIVLKAREKAARSREKRF